MLVYLVLPFLLFDDVKRGRKGYLVCLVFSVHIFQDIQIQNKGGDIQDRGSFAVQTLLTRYVFVIIKKGEIVKKISFFELGWVSMMTTLIQKEEKLQEDQVKDRT